MSAIGQRQLGYIGAVAQEQPLRRKLPQRQRHAKARGGLEGRGHRCRAEPGQWLPAVVKGGVEKRKFDFSFDRAALAAACTPKQTGKDVKRPLSRRSSAAGEREGESESEREFNIGG